MTPRVRLPQLGGMTEAEYQEAIARLPDVQGPLAQRTPEQRQEDWARLAALPLKELRLRQKLIQPQRIVLLVELRAARAPASLARIARGLSDLAEMENDYEAAIEQIMFGDLS